VLTVHSLCLFVCCVCVWARTRKNRLAGRLAVDARGFSLSVAGSLLPVSVSHPSCVVCLQPCIACEAVTTNRDSDFVLGWPIGRLAEFGDRLILI
jgi:hypothetical protein